MFRKVWHYFFPPHSPECRHILSLLDDRDKWSFKEDKNGWHTIRRGGIELMPSWYTVVVWVHGVAATEAFTKRERTAMFYRADRVLCDLKHQHESAEAAAAKARAKQALKELAA